MLMQQRRSARRAWVPRARSLTGRHARQIGGRLLPAQQRLQGVFGLTFLPGDRTSTFAEKVLRPVGKSVAVVLEYRRDGMPLHGHAAGLSTDGKLCYRPDERRFLFDAGLELDPAAHGHHLNVRTNQSLIEIALQLDRCCERRATDTRFVPREPVLPRIKLGFAPDQPPQFEVTDGLRRSAARNVGVPLERLATNPEVLVERLLTDTWHSVLVPPHGPGNPTDLLMVDAEFCTQASRALRIFEDYRELVGTMTWNPARAVDILRVENPALAVLERHAIDPAQGFDQPFARELVEQLEADMRKSLGDLVEFFSTEDLLDGLTQPGDPLVACTRAIGPMRAKLTSYWSECSTDRDLRTAARYPKDALLASGACSIQVIRRPASGSLRFGPEDLRRRATVDWTAGDRWESSASEADRGLISQSA